MFTIQHSIFLQALGYTIGHSIWQLGIIWLIYYAVSHANHLRSKTKYAFAVGASVAGSFCFLATFFYYFTQNLIANSETTALLNPAIFTTSGSENISSLLFFYHSIVSTLSSLAPFFSCAYLMVMMVLVARLANGFLHIKQLKAKGLEKSPYELKHFVGQKALSLGIKKEVKVFISTIATTPLTIGFWKPIILIPLASLNHLTSIQMEAVLLHELAHIRRHDYLINVLLQSVEILMFFNPFMRLLLKQARLERENSCDDFVLQYDYDAADYARALLALETYSCASLLALGSNNKNEFQLFHRIKRMVAPERHSFNYKQQLGVLFFITLLCLGFTVMAPKPSSEKPAVIAKINAKIKVENTAVPSPIYAGLDLVKSLENMNVSSEKQIKNVAEVTAKKIQDEQEKNMIQLAELNATTMEPVGRLLEKSDFKKAIDELAILSESNENTSLDFVEVARELSKQNVENAIQLEIDKALAETRIALSKLPRQIMEAKLESEQIARVKNSLFNLNSHLISARDKAEAEKSRMKNEWQKRKKEAEAEAEAMWQKHQFEVRQQIENQVFTFNTNGEFREIVQRKPRIENNREAPVVAGIAIAKAPLKLAKPTPVPPFSQIENQRDLEADFLVKKVSKAPGKGKVSVNDKTIFTWENNLDPNTFAQDLIPMGGQLKLEIPYHQIEEIYSESAPTFSPKSGSKKVIIIIIDRGETNIKIQSSRKP